MTSRSDPEYYRRQAETCHEMAEKATDARDREGWLRLAKIGSNCLSKAGGTPHRLVKRFYHGAAGEGLKVVPVFSMAQATLRRRSATDRRARP